MLTFEKVMEIFNDFLSQDECCEVVMTKRGHVVLDWPSKHNNFLTAVYCGTSEELMESILSTYSSELELRITHGQRDMTEREAAEVEAQCELIREKCKA